MLTTWIPLFNMAPFQLFLSLGCMQPWVRKGAGQSWCWMFFHAIPWLAGSVSPSLSPPWLHAAFIEQRCQTMNPTSFHYTSILFNHWPVLQIDNIVQTRVYKNTRVVLSSCLWKFLGWAQSNRMKWDGRKQTSCPSRSKMFFQLATNHEQVSDVLIPNWTYWTLK